MRPLVVVLALILSAAAVERVIASQQAASPTRAVAAGNAGGAPSAGSQAATNASPRLRVQALSRLPITVDPAATDPQSIDRLIQRAGASVPAERETVRAALAKNQGNAQLANALADRALALRTRDYSATLTALSLLGELRAPAGEKRLLQFTAIPLPTQGHVVEGELVERTTLEQLQMKAVQGLAYERTPSGDAAVLQLAAASPSRNVRAEAVEAYLYNHGYSAAARKALGAVLQPADRIYLDRPHLLPGMTAGAFNLQLATYLKLHPNLVAPVPQHLRADPTLIARDRAKDALLLKAPVTAVNRLTVVKPLPPPDRSQ